jgi:hypothetical protein
MKNDTINENEEYYYQQLGTIKLSNIMNDEKLWNLYYASDLYPLAYDVLNILAILNQLEQDKENKSYDNSYMEFLTTMTDTIKTLSSNINKYNFTIIKNKFLNLLQTLVLSYQNSLLTDLIHESSVTLEDDTEIEINQDNSCLDSLFNLYEKYFDIELEESLISVDESILKCSTFLKKLNLSL